MQNQVALGAQRSSTPVKGGIARAPGSTERWGWTGSTLPYGGAERFLVMSVAGPAALAGFLLTLQACPMGKRRGKLLAA